VQSASSPKVSIVIPVFNGSDYLAEAIDSALAQTWSNCELIVVDDGSTDGGATEAVARSYGSRLRYCRKPNGHVASALNYGIRHMSGDYLSWLSHDDLYHRDKVAAQMKVLREQATGTVAYSDFEILEQAGGRRAAVRMPPADPGRFRLYLTLRNCLHGCTLLIPRRALDEAGPFDETLRTTQDYDMWFRLARRSRFVHVPAVLVTARHHAGQGTHQLRDLAVAECDRLLTGFVHELAPEEVNLAGATLARSWGSVAVNLAARGFSRASTAAIARGRAALRGARPVSGLRDALTLRLCGEIGRLLGLARSMVSRAKGAPGAAVAWLRARRMSVGQRFSSIYQGNLFGGAQSRSGAGSSMEQTAALREALPVLLHALQVRTMIDAPCGDFFWMQHANLGIEQYIGIDIVEALIERNRSQFAGERREFRCLNLIDDPLPRADLIFCRDCLVHLNHAQARKALRNFQRSGAKYLLTTTFTARERNVDLGARGMWRALNLERAPFNLPRPLRLIDERCTEGGGAYTDKCLGLWPLQDLKLD